MKKLFFIVLLFVFGCSKELKMNDYDLQKAQNERNQKVMIDSNPMIIPPDFEKVPTEEESQYVEPEDNRTLWTKFLKTFNL